MGKLPTPDYGAQLWKHGKRVLAYIRDYISDDYRGTFFIAGGAILKWPPNDIDIFQQTGEPIPKFVVLATKVYETPAAITYKAGRYPIQVSRVLQPTLIDLVESFDLSHLQAGIKVYYDQGWCEIRQVYYTQEYIEAQLTGSTIFTGSERPLASLLRFAKYYKRDEISKTDYIKAQLGALAAVISRGVSSHEDFHNQLCGLSEDVDTETLLASTPQLRKLTDLLMIRKSYNEDVE